MPARPPSRLRNLVVRHLREEWTGLSLAAFCMFGLTGMELLSPWPIKIVIDNILLNKAPKGLLAPWSGFLNGDKTTAAIVIPLSIILISVFKGALDYGQLFITSRIGYHMVYKLRRELFLHLQRLSLSFHDQARSGEVLTKITSDANALKDVFAESALDFAGYVALVIAMFVAMFMLNWRLSLIVAAVFPFLAHSCLVAYRNIKVAAKRQREREGRVVSRIVEVLSSVSLVQAFSREKYEQERFDKESSRTLEESVSTARMEAAASRRVELISSLGRSLTVLFGSLQVLNGRMTPGDIVVFTSYVAGMYKPMRAIARLASHFSKAAASAERISTILDTEAGTPDRPGAIAATGLKGDVALQDVWFSYGDSRPVLRGVSFRIHAGEHVALVGASGAGKSTIVSLMLRLYDPASGEIAFDGIDARDYFCDSLRREIGVVLQDAILFGASIRENITYGKPDASQADVERAAREANIHNFIAGLPGGYETIVGERGCTLSGGQRQRLCLARAVIRRPPVLILDEPTSAVDAESANLIRDAVERLQQHNTLLMIAHQFVGMERFDRILVLKDGAVAEQGTHAELLAINGRYEELYRLQAIDPGVLSAVTGARREGRGK